MGLFDVSMSSLGIGDIWGDVTGQNAAKDAAAAMAAAQNRAIDLQREMWQQSRKDLSQYRKTGRNALRDMRNFEAPTFSLDDFQASPDYQFRLNQGMDTINSGATAGGMRLSGRTLKALNDYGQNTASQEYGNWYGRRMGESQDQWNRLAQMAGLGGSATSQAASANQNMANAIGQSYNNIGQGNAAAAMQGYNGMMNLFNLGARGFGMA